MLNRFRYRVRLLGSEEGQAYIEYVVLGSLAVLVILASVQFFFGSIAALFQRLGSALGGF